MDDARIGAGRGADDRGLRRGDGSRVSDDHLSRIRQDARAVADELDGIAAEEPAAGRTTDPARVVVELDEYVRSRRSDD